ncbi:hypothetical protein FQN54_001052 [Arachnomyces sp. PD_36]|nr:hypothetical protein FQN54_001052 [Arachnomyces sp. PD_36]
MQVPTKQSGQWLTLKLVHFLPDGFYDRYYVLVAACVFARKADWLRNACLAAVLLFPAVAAIHGIVLAALHVNGAIDMDVYGAFQLCAIGIMTAPVTVRRSRTYFYDPGRNTIFMWTGLILAGNSISSDPIKFPYQVTSCGLICSVEGNPRSPLRGGSASNINVIPVPDKLTFSTATLFAAACCIPAILSLVFMWDKILEINWRTSFENGGEGPRMDEPIEGTNGATVGKMRGVNALVRKFLSTIEIPVFGAAVFAILIMGERNFFSPQMRFETEPIASIGQWAPIVGTGLAILGSLYLVMAADQEVREDGPNMNTSIDPNSFPANLPGPVDMGRSFSNESGGSASERLSTISASASESPSKGPRTDDRGNRLKIARTLSVVSNYLGTASPELFDVSAFKHGKALNFPETPGEENKNPDLPRIRERYNRGRDLRRSRAGSFNDSAPSAFDSEGISMGSRGSSPRPSMSSTTSRLHRSALPTERISSDLSSRDPSVASGSVAPRLRERRDTLEVPPPVHFNSVRNSPPNPSASAVTRESPGPPTIVISSESSSP